MFTKSDIEKLNQLFKLDAQQLDDLSNESITTKENPPFQLAKETIESKGALLEKLNDSTYKISVPKDILTYALDEIENVKINSPYGFKGGCARIVLEDLLNLPKVNVRDIDLVRLYSISDKSHDYFDQDTLLSEKYMPDDFQHGYGVDTEYDVESYLKSRDFTRNEVLIIPSANGYEIFCSKDCLKDTTTGTIELSEYERDSDSGKLFVKAVRWYTEERMQGRELALADIGDRWNVRSFDVALQLDRIKDPQIARLFAHKVYELNVMALNDWEPPNTLDPVEEIEHLRLHLSEYLYDGVTFFRTDLDPKNEQEEDLRKQLDPDS